VKLGRFEVKGGHMRLLGVWLVALMLLSACAALKQTETLPSPNETDTIPGGPEGESDYEP
jgi:hypothetical protein